MILVLSGLRFSYIQFRHGLSHQPQIKDNLGDGREDNEKLDVSAQERTSITSNTPNFQNTEIQIDKNGIKISSSVIGLITLVISLAFLYLYLVYVHPIKVLNLNSTSNGNQIE